MLSSMVATTSIGSSPTASTMRCMHSCWPGNQTVLRLISARPRFRGRAGCAGGCATPTQNTFPGTACATGSSVRSVATQTSSLWRNNPAGCRSYGAAIVSGL